MLSYFSNKYENMVSYFTLWLHADVKGIRLISYKKYKTQINSLQY